MAKRTKRYWLLKSEPGTYSIDDLERDGTTAWTGIRNYQARNYMRDDMAVGDEVLFYHSSAKPPGVAGLARISGAAVPEADDPTWVQVEVAFVKKLATFVPIADLKANPGLAGMLVTMRGQRLSVQPVTKAHFQEVVRMGR